VADTDESWDVEEEKAVRALRPQVHGYYAADPGIRIDGAAFDWSWDSSANLDRPWTKAVALGRGSLRGETDAPNNWQLVSDPLPSMEMHLVPPGRVVRATGIAIPSTFPELRFTVPAHGQGQHFG